MIRTASDNLSTLSAGELERDARARYSASNHPAPNPRVNRPPERTSTVAAILASTAGFLRSLQTTSAPSRTVVVQALRAAQTGKTINNFPLTGGPAVAGQVVEQVVGKPDRVRTPRPPPFDAQPANSCQPIGPTGQAEIVLRQGQPVMQRLRRPAEWARARRETCSR